MASCFPAAFLKPGTLFEQGVLCFHVALSHKRSRQPCLSVSVQFPDQNGLTVPHTLEQAIISSFLDFLCPGHVLCPAPLLLAAADRDQERQAEPRLSLACSTCAGSGEGHACAPSEERPFWGRTASPGSWQSREVSLMPPAPLNIHHPPPASPLSPSIGPGSVENPPAHPPGGGLQAGAVTGSEQQSQEMMAGQALRMLHVPGLEPR